MRLLLVVFVLLVMGCKPLTEEQRRQQMEADLKEIDRLQQDRFRYEAEQKKALDAMKTREAINRAKANW